MRIIHKEKVMPHTSEQMYCLVDNVDNYHTFVPWCVGSQELSRKEHVVEATLRIGHKGIFKSFTTRNEGKPHESLDMHLVQGPFKHLHGRWDFIPLDEKRTHVKMHLEFEFSSKLLAMVFAPIFNEVAGSLVNAFSKQADLIYPA